MEPTAELIRALAKEEVQDARRLSVERKLELSGELFDSACQITLSGIRMQHPHLSLEQAQAVLRDRLALGRRLEALTLELDL